MGATTNTSYSAPRIGPRAEGEWLLDELNSIPAYRSAWPKMILSGLHGSVLHLRAFNGYYIFESNGTVLMSPKRDGARHMIGILRPGAPTFEFAKGQHPPIMNVLIAGCDAFNPEAGYAFTSAPYLKGTYDMLRKASIVTSYTTRILLAHGVPHSQYPRPGQQCLLRAHHALTETGHIKFDWGNTYGEPGVTPAAPAALAAKADSRECKILALHEIEDIDEGGDARN